MSTELAVIEVKEVRYIIGVDPAYDENEAGSRQAVLRCYGDGRIEVVKEGS